MRHLSISCTVMLVGFLYFIESVSPVLAHNADPCEGLREWTLFVKGRPATEFVADFRNGLISEEDKEQFFNELGYKLNDPGLVDVLQLMDTNPAATQENLPDALLGLGGLTTTLLLQNLLLEENNKPPVERVLYGKIRDYVFIKATGQGHISVDICIDRKKFVPGGANGKPADLREFYHWDIEIAENGFKVAERTPPSDAADENTYKDPFSGVNMGSPDDFVMPKEAVDPSNPKSVWRRGLDHKLYAKGTVITVKNIYYRKLIDPELTRLPNSHQSYQIKAGSCVDLFTKGYPPATLAELAAGGYCLGRCQSPPIVNSGD